MWPLLFFVALAALLASLFFWRRQVARLEAQRDRLERESEQARAREEHGRVEFRTREEALLNSISEGILFLDTRGGITGANEALAQMFRLAGPVKGKSLLEAFRLYALEDLATAVEKSGLTRVAEIAVAGDPQRFFEVGGSVWRRPDGDGIILTFHEITRLKHLENVRKEFVANVSHELRTPLSLIKGFSETLLDGAIADAAAAERFVRTIHRNAERLALIIDDLLTISSLESGQMALEKQTLRLHPLVQRVVSDLQARAERPVMKVENLVAHDLVVCADLQRLQQVFTNLIDNAIKYGGHRGHIEVTAEKLPDGSTRVGVADEGPGIPAEALERIFERFYRVDKARSREQGGTGLGLSIVKHIIQSHGGRVWAESVLEKGSTFWFTLPAEEKDPEIPGNTRAQAY